MSPRDRCYFERRAHEELELALRATTPRACRAHYRLAECYLEKVFGYAAPADARSQSAA